MKENRTEPATEPEQQNVKLPPDERRCTSVAKDGERCKAWAMKGEKQCAGHAGAGFGADPRAAASKSAEVRKGHAEERKRRAVDVYRDAMERHADEFVNARLSIIRDPDASAADRLRAMEQLEARALGKPKETVEHQVDVPESWAKLQELPLADLLALQAELERKAS